MAGSGASTAWHGVGLLASGVQVADSGADHGGAWLLHLAASIGIAVSGAQGGAGGVWGWGIGVQGCRGGAFCLRYPFSLNCIFF